MTLDLHFYALNLLDPATARRRVLQRKLASPTGANPRG